MGTENSILVKTYDLLKFLIGFLKAFPRDQRFLLADRIQNLASDILELFIEAYYAPPDVKKPNLRSANIKLEMLRYYIRLGYELGFYNSLKYGEVADKIQEIGRMAGGWLKALEHK